MLTASNNQKYQDIDEQLSTALFLQQLSVEQDNLYYLSNLYRRVAAELIVTWYAEGVTHTFDNHRHEEIINMMILDDGKHDLVPELRELIDTLPSDIRSSRWRGIINTPDFDDGITDADLVAQALDGEVDLYGYIKYLYIDYTERHKICL